MQPNSDREPDNAGAISDTGEVRLTYEAVFTYHHALVQSRFATVGVYLAMNAFLAGAYFSEKASTAPPALLPVLAVTLTQLTWLMDKRTYHLLENLVSRGRRIETMLKIPEGVGFFALMNGPQKEPEIKERWRKRIVSHSFVIKWIHVSIAVFWIILLFNHH